MIEAIPEKLNLQKVGDFATLLLINNNEYQNICEILDVIDIFSLEEIEEWINLNMDEDEDDENSEYYSYHQESDEIYTKISHLGYSSYEHSLQCSSELVSDVFIYQLKQVKQSLEEADENNIKIIKSILLFYSMFFVQNNTIANFRPNEFYFFTVFPDLENVLTPEAIISFVDENLPFVNKSKQFFLCSIVYNFYKDTDEFLNKYITAHPFVLDLVPNKNVFEFMSSNGESKGYIAFNLLLTSEPINDIPKALITYYNNFSQTQLFSQKVLEHPLLQQIEQKYNHFYFNDQNKYVWALAMNYDGELSNVISSPIILTQKIRQARDIVQTIKNATLPNRLNDKPQYLDFFTKNKLFYFQDDLDESSSPELGQAEIDFYTVYNGTKNSDILGFLELGPEITDKLETYKEKYGYTFHCLCSQYLKQNDDTDEVISFLEDLTETLESYHNPVFTINVFTLLIRNNIHQFNSNIFPQEVQKTSDKVKLLFDIFSSNDPGYIANQIFMAPLITEQFLTNKTEPEDWLVHSLDSGPLKNAKFYKENNEFEAFLKLHKNKEYGTEKYHKILKHLSLIRDFYKTFLGKPETKQLVLPDEVIDFIINNPQIIEIFGHKKSQIQQRFLTDILLKLPDNLPQETINEDTIHIIALLCSKTSRNFKFSADLLKPEGDKKGIISLLKKLKNQVNARNLDALIAQIYEASESGSHINELLIANEQLLIDYLNDFKEFSLLKFKLYKSCTEKNKPRKQQLEGKLKLLKNFHKYSIDELRKLGLLDYFDYMFPRNFSSSYADTNNLINCKDRTCDWIRPDGTVLTFQEKYELTIQETVKTRKKQYKISPSDTERITQIKNLITPDSNEDHFEVDLKLLLQNIDEAKNYIAQSTNKALDNKIIADLSLNNASHLEDLIVFLSETTLEDTIIPFLNDLNETEIQQIYFSLKRQKKLKQSKLNTQLENNSRFQTNTHQKLSFETADPSQATIARINQLISEEPDNSTIDEMKAYISNSIFEKERNFLKSQLDNFDTTIKNRAEIYAKFDKTSVSAGARRVAGVCISTDNPNRYEDDEYNVSMWDNPDYYQLVLYDKKTDQCKGLVIFYLWEDTDGKSTLVVSQNPSNQLVLSTNQKTLADNLLKIITDFAQQNNIDQVAYSTADGTLTNRTGGEFEEQLRDQIQRFGNKTVNIKPKVEPTYKSEFANLDGQRSTEHKQIQKQNFGRYFRSNTSSINYYIDEVSLVWSNDSII